MRIAVTLLVGVAAFASGYFVYRKDNKRRPSHFYYALAAGSIGIWVVARALLLAVGDNPAGLVIGHVVVLTPGFIALFLYLFAFHYGHEQKPLPSGRLKLLLFGPAMLLAVIAVTPGLVIETVAHEVSEFSYGPLFATIYVPILLGYFVATVYLLVRSYRKAGNITFKRRLRYILGGGTLAIGIAVVTNLFLPIAGVTSLLWFGPISSIILTVSVGYALTRSDLWDFKLAATETFLFLTLIALFTQIFAYSDDISRAAFKTGVFFLTAILGVFLIRAIGHEISARQHAEELSEALAKANQRLKEIDVERSEFVSIASHQLRTPLTVIRGYSSMLLEGSFGPVNDKSKRMILEKINNASNRLVAMINEFLDISRIERGKLEYNFGRIDVKRTVHEVAREFGPTAAESGVSIHENFDRRRPAPIIGDDLKLRQVITNLIDNAIKYTPAGGEITITVADRDEEIVVAVSDTGIGFDANAKARLFRKFSRNRTAARLQTQGRGLGLYIAKRIMLDHHGRIWAQSEGEGKGSTFSIAFPKPDSALGRREVNTLLSHVS